MSINTGPSPLGLQQELHTGLTTIRWALHFCRQLSQEKPYHLVETYTLPGEEPILGRVYFFESRDDAADGLTQLVGQALMEVA